MIMEALFKRIRRAHDERQPFKVFIVMPLLPSGPEDLEAKEGDVVYALIALQNYTIGEGKGSFFERLRAVNIEPAEYIMILSLRKWEFSPLSSLKENSRNEYAPNTSDPVSALIYVHTKVRFADSR